MAPIKVDLWEIVRDWVKEHYHCIDVSRFPTESSLPQAYDIQHLGRITFGRPLQEIEEIGFVSPKGVMIWQRDGQLDYTLLVPTDPHMFEKLDVILETYESKRPK